MKKKILVIDDDPDILEAVKILLEDEGYEIETSDKPENITDRPQSDRPSLLVLDVLLSGSDGREYAQSLKTNDQTQDIPIIMLSAHPAAKQTVASYGANEFLEKPFDIKDLVNLIKKYTE